MKLDQLLSFFSTNPSAKLLGSPHSAYIVFFLHQQFKEEGNLAVRQSDLQQQLHQFLQQVHQTDRSVLRDRAETYLTRWSTGESRWLRRYFDSQHAESVYQLTPHTEDVLKFLTDVLDRSLGFVGTESRMTRIMETLSDIAVRGCDDPQRRLSHLYAERERIEAEIRSIEAGDAVTTHSPTAIRERFSDAVSDLISLQGDFRAVEESFKAITRTVQKQQVESADSRGDILGSALDAEQRLKQEDQGASFDAFVRLILSQSQQDALERIIAQIDGISELSKQVDGKNRIKGMVGNLSAEAEKVLHTTRRLSSTLRRLLDSRTSTTRLRLASVLRDIKTAMARRSEAPPEIGLELFTELDLASAWQRTFWESPVRFDEVVVSNEEPDEDERLLAFRDLAAMQRLDWANMRRNIAALLRSSDRFTLPQLLSMYPPSSGSMEVLGYIQLAHDDGHVVDEGGVETVTFKDSDSVAGMRSYEIPRVIFRRAVVPCEDAGKETLEAGSHEP